MKIAINAQLCPGKGAGGVETVLTALIHALGQLKDGGEEYLIVGPHENPDWLSPFLGENQEIVRGPATEGPELSRSAIKRAIKKPLQRAAKAFCQLGQPWPQPEISNGFWEKLGCDAVHFPYQDFVVCSIPTLFSPHDLQHLHLPQFFSAKELVLREVIYRTGCQLSRQVIVGSQWVKDDIERQYRIHPDKIQVIPLAAPMAAYGSPSSEVVESVRKKYGLQEPFGFYPAMTWPHKNHIGLLQALAHLRDKEGIRLNIVCSGFQNSFWQEIEREWKKLKLESQVKFLGYLPAEELKALYSMSTYVVIPTLFESTSELIFEAWEENTPVLCSAVTALPEQVQDAAFLFNPHEMESIAQALKTVSQDEKIRCELVEKGKRRLSQFSWEKTARAYRAVYRKAAGKTLDKNEVALLSTDWMKTPATPLSREFI
jgi:glycosyltransferase involved in cell wall biosynthesis